MTNGIVLQSGGPTAVVNASLWKLVDSWQRAFPETHIWGARHGWRGFLGGDWTDLTEWRLSIKAQMQFIAQPGAALGGGRDRLEDGAIPALLDRLKAHEIGAVFVIGGNGSMAAARRLHQAAGGAVRVIGVPKTIDNDLPGTDVCPGYIRSAGFVARMTHDLGLDLQSMRGFDDVAVVEIMGRHAGWLAAASALARCRQDFVNDSLAKVLNDYASARQAMLNRANLRRIDREAAPHLILLPEVSFDEGAFLAAVKRVHAAKGICLVVTAEGIRDGAGQFLAEKSQSMEKDASGQKLLALAGGPTPYLARLVQEKLGLRCRQIRPDTIQRSHGIGMPATDTDALLAMGVGSRAVAAYSDGHSGVMMGVQLKDAESIAQFQWEINPIPLDEVVGRERCLPPDFIDVPNFDVTEKFLEYARPLVGELPGDVVVL